MGHACKLCVLVKGLKLDDPWIFDTEDLLFDHLERDHHLIITREGETDQQARERVYKAQPERATCPDCLKREYSTHGQMAA